MAGERTLTQKQLERLQPADRGQTLKDGGGLTGKVGLDRASGDVTVGFTFRYRAGSTTRAISCGTWPRQSLADIRGKRDQLRDQVRNDIDPIEKARADKAEAERKAAEAARLAAEAAEVARREALRLTFSDLFWQWKERALSTRTTADGRRQGRKDGGTEIERAFTRDVLPYLGTFFADTITRKQIAEVLHRIVERGSGRQANVTLSNLRQCFGWAIGAGLLDADPTSHLKKEAFGGKEEPRERHLSEDEIKQLLRSALPGSNLTDKAKSAVKVLLATGVRVSELLSAKREDIDLDKSEWSIAENKSDRPHVVQLSNFAASAMKEILAIRDHDVWLFPSRTGDDHVCEKTLTKQIGDRQRGDKPPMKGRSKTKHANSLALPGGRWTPHDLRRTASTLMGELGVLDQVIERCLNHTEENKIKRTYQRQQLLAARKDAFALLGNKLEVLAGLRIDEAPEVLTENLASTNKVMCPQD
jgi:integrase